MFIDAKTWATLSPDEKWIAIIAGLRPAQSKTRRARAKLGLRGGR